MACAEGACVMHGDTECYMNESYCDVVVLYAGIFSMNQVIY